MLRREPCGAATLVLALAAACGDGAAPDSAADADGADGWADDAGAPDAGPADEAPPAPLYAEAVVSFSPGPHAGFGQGEMPDVALGPPRGGGTTSGSLDVVSLGVGGTIVLDFGARAIVDGEGPDLVVFENAFWPGGDATRVFAEPGEVSVSEDGETWFTFACDATGDGAGRYPGCAGVSPTLVFDPALEPLDPARTGGDAFDLAQLGQPRARYVRVRDLSTEGAGISAGFDLDAVGAIHRAP